jgi:membrane protein
MSGCAEIGILHCREPGARGVFRPEYQAREGQASNRANADETEVADSRCSPARRIFFGIDLNNSRFESLLSWVAATVVTATAVIYALKPGPSRARPGPGFAEAGPAQEPLAVQKARAAEPGRGRDASTPQHIPWRGWKDVLLRTYQEVQNDRLLALAAGVVFYSLVALFPAIAAGVSSYALVADANTIAKHLTLLANVVPGGTLELLGTEITRIATNSDGKLTLGFVIGLLIALWSANAGMKAIFDALNIIYDEQEKRSFVWLNLVSLFFTFCAIAGALLAVAAVVVFPLVLAAFGLSSFDQPIIGVLRWPVMLGLLLIGLAVLYRYGPSRREAKWRWLSVGSVFAAIVWLIMSSLFSWYLGNFANYNATYGSLGAVVGLMMWMWFSTIVVLVGAEFNAEIEHQTARDSTVGPEKPLGVRGAVVADTVGPAQD